ncbi:MULTISPECIES: hypothetical protein [Haloferax]|uniref:Uncharacterized protein n=1 Tax=Haloferax marinum TaxID=2666143 RepID=A0A6A8GAB4_9EURY|nr:MULTISPECIES: hypothetical protein [Haloferax]KAB1198437.1 hypothetical protein Hfx1150_13300 [Haloferax sp. CBA1150]MRW97538.1 hypothetical protein [Haloferax marinum]
MEPVWSRSDLGRYLESIVNEDDIEEQLIQESRWKISYRESQLERRGLLRMHREAMSLEEKKLDWADLGLTDQAKETLDKSGVEETELHRFFAHPGVLVESPGLFHYYRTLAGVSENRLRDMKTVRPAVRNLTGSTKSPEVDDPTRRLCRYFNSLISTWASGITDGEPKQRALTSALLTEGAAIEGSSRNAGGKKAVVNVASVIVADLHEHDRLDAFVVKQTSSDDFDRVSAAELGESYPLSDLSGAYDVDAIYAKNGGKVSFSEPDMIVESPSGVTGYGEIKDRKDISNQWEGWLPLIRSKLVDFKSRNSSAKRMVLQPVFTERMIDGERGSDAEDVGVRGFIDEDLLDVPFNISKILADEDSREFFGDYIRSLLGYSVEVLTVPST